MKKFEEGMKSKKDKKKTIDLFVKDTKYNAEIRSLVENAIFKSQFVVLIKDIRSVIKKKILKTEYDIPPPAKRLKKDE